MKQRDEVEVWITAKLAKVSDERMPAESIRASTRLRQDLGVTSLMAVNVVLDVEQQFGIEVTDEDLMRMGTAGDVIDMVMTKLHPRPAGME
jgi:acyl carrier protein